VRASDRCTSCRGKQPLDAGSRGRFDDGELDGQIIAKEVGRIGRVRVNSADLRGGEEHVFGAFLFEEGAHGVCVAEIEPWRLRRISS
jgi:hypothetical protein